MAKKYFQKQSLGQTLLALLLFGGGIIGMMYFNQ
tara:strand:- start:4369 stop:4470 length:102 start_codon:yes stop_codon:yes gene_type:complete